MTESYVKIELTEAEQTALYDAVELAIQDLISSFEEPLRKKAESVSCYLDAYCPLAKHPQAIGQMVCFDEQPTNVLGQYRTWDLYEGGAIFIYVEAIYKAESKNLETTCASARQVYLHELGHVLGLNELELDERGI